VSTDLPISDDDRASQAWADASLKAILKHILPGFWPIAVGAFVAVGSTALAITGAVRLGSPWAWLALAYAGAVLVYFLHHFNKARAVAVAATYRPADDRRDEVLAKLNELDTHSRWRFLRGWPFWKDRIIYTIPKGALITYAALAWWPLPAALALAAVPFIWAAIGRAVKNDRISPAMSLLLQRRGSEGLPTFEV